MTWIKSSFQNAIPHHVTRPPNSNSSTPRSSQCSNKGIVQTVWSGKSSIFKGRNCLASCLVKNKTLFLKSTVYSPPPESITSMTEIDLKTPRWVISNLICSFASDYRHICIDVHLMSHAFSCFQYGGLDCSGPGTFNATAGA